MHRMTTRPPNSPRPSGATCPRSGSGTRSTRPSSSLRRGRCIRSAADLQEHLENTRSLLGQEKEVLLFDQTFVNAQAQTRRPWTVALSVSLQSALVATLLVVPLLRVTPLDIPTKVPIW